MTDSTRPLPASRGVSDPQTSQVASIDAEGSAESDRGPDGCPFVVDCQEHGVIGAYQSHRLAERYRDQHEDDFHGAVITIRYRPENLHEQ